MSDPDSAQVVNELMTQFAPPLSRSMLVQTTAQALGNAAHNATFVQQQQNSLISTNTSVGTSILHAIGGLSVKS